MDSSSQDSNKQQQSNFITVSGFIFSLLGLFAFFGGLLLNLSLLLATMFLGPVGIILSLVGLFKETKKGLAIGGILIGLMDLALIWFLFANSFE